MSTSLRKLTPEIKVQFFVEPFHRMFSLDNLSIQYPHATVERVPVCESAILNVNYILAELDSLNDHVAWLFGYAGGIPLLLLVLWAVLFKPDGHKVHVTLLGFFIR